MTLDLKFHDIVTTTVATDDRRDFEIFCSIPNDDSSPSSAVHNKKKARKFIIEFENYTIFS